MEFAMNPYIVYAKTDSCGYITAVNSSAFLADTTGWVEIDRGFGDKHHHAQWNFFPQPIITEGGAYRYKLIDGMVTECSESEILDQEEAQKRNTPPTLQDRVDALETTAEDMILLMAEMIGGM